MATPETGRARGKTKNVVTAAAVGLLLSSAQAVVLSPRASSNFVEINTPGNTNTPLVSSEVLLNAYQLGRSYHIDVARYLLPSNGYGWLTSTWDATTSNWRMVKTGLSFEHSALNQDGLYRYQFSDNSPYSALFGSTRLVNLDLKTQAGDTTGILLSGINSLSIGGTSTDGIKTSWVAPTKMSLAGQSNAPILVVGGQYTTVYSSFSSLICDHPSFCNGPSQGDALTTLFYANATDYRNLGVSGDPYVQRGGANKAVTSGTLHNNGGSTGITAYDGAAGSATNMLQLNANEYVTFKGGVKVNTLGSRPIVAVANKLLHATVDSTLVLQESNRAPAFTANVRGQYRNGSNQVTTAQQTSGTLGTPTEYNYVDFSGQITTIDTKPVDPVTGFSLTTSPVAPAIINAIGIEMLNPGKSDNTSIVMLEMGRRNASLNTPSQISLGINVTHGTGVFAIGGADVNIDVTAQSKIDLSNAKGVTTGILAAAVGTTNGSSRLMNTTTGLSKQLVSTTTAANTLAVSDLTNYNSSQVQENYQFQPPKNVPYDYRLTATTYPWFSISNQGEQEARPGGALDAASSNPADMSFQSRIKPGLVISNAGTIQVAGDMTQALSTTAGYYQNIFVPMGEANTQNSAANAGIAAYTINDPATVNNSGSILTGGGSTIYVAQQGEVAKINDATIRASNITKTQSMDTNDLGGIVAPVFDLPSAQNVKLTASNSGSIGSTNPNGFQGPAIAVVASAIQQDASGADVTSSRQINIQAQNTGNIDMGNSGHAASVFYLRAAKNGTLDMTGQTGSIASSASDFNEAALFQLIDADEYKSLNFAQTGGTLMGNIETRSRTTTPGDGTDTLTFTDVTYKGNFRLGQGNDTLSFLGNSDLSNVFVMDGGINADSSQGTDVLKVGGTIMLNGQTPATGSANNAQIINWSDIKVLDQARLNLTGDLGQTATAALSSLQIGPAATLSKTGVNQVNVYADQLSNAGTIDLRDTAGKPLDVLTLHGNYVGLPGSKLVTVATWTNPNDLQTDLLKINGNASGATTVAVAGGIFGDVTRDQQQKISSNPVVQVDRAHADNVFTGAAPTTNAGEAQLIKQGNNYYWTLEATPPPPPSPSPTPTPTPVPPAPPAPPTPPAPTAPPSAIISQPVPGYLQTQQANMEMGFSQLGKLHERVSEQQTWAWDDCGTRCDQYDAAKKAHKKIYPMWGRLNADYLKLQGNNRYGLKSTTGFVQFGGDLNVAKNQDDQSRRHNGVIVTYGWGNHDFYDSKRATNGLISSDQYTGKSNTDMLSLGGYSTWYANNGTYVDLVGQLSWIHNKYASRDGYKVNQSGWGLGLSAEVGRPWQIGSSQWLIEPQAQLSYQTVRLGDIHDGVRQVSSMNADALRARIGARLAWNDRYKDQLRTKTFYLTANVLRDLWGNEPSVNVGRETVQEQYGKTWAELGVGTQWALSKASYLYMDLRYQRSLGSNNGALGSDFSSASREGYNGRIGVRHSW
ncbi:autotransporter outer membrane beta-barrel domain-containing protein [Comamonas sp. Y33R10-2]|nr:autotransporter outer membrane beta-barrel domain-containing protein [Comamonas sp. Y33R10-2]